MIRDPLSEENLSRIFKTDPNNPTRLIKREDKCHEFKESYNNGNMATYLKTIAAFANHDGGYIIFGVKNSPRELLGLKDKALQQFSELPIEKLTELLNKYFAPSIDWKSCVFQFRGKSYGIIYVFELECKPTICKESKDFSEKKYVLKEGEIYYRYAGRSERIKYAELAKIIDDKRKREEKQWLRFLMKAATVGVENASILDLKNGEIKEGGNRIVIDEPLLEKIRFVKEGKFVEKEGAPTLRLMGDIQSVETGKVIYSGTKKVVRSIEQTEIVEAFLNNERVENPTDYIKRICSSSTGNLPVYYYIGLVGLSAEKTIELIRETTARGKAKQILLKKISEFSPIIPKSFPKTETAAAKKRRECITWWTEHTVPLEMTDGELKSCISSITYLEREAVLAHINYIKGRMLDLYKKYYEKSDSITASIFRDAICYLDSVEFFNRDSGKTTEKEHSAKQS